MKKSKEPRLGIIEVAPEDLVIIGLDTSDGPEHKRYDPRIKLPVSEALVSSISRIWFGTVACVDVDGRLEIQFGRQRTRAARALNARLVAAGRTPILIRAQVVSQGDERLLTDMSIMENECRQDDDSFTKAVKTKAYLAGDHLGKRTVEEAMVAFGCSEATINSRLGLLEMAPQVQEAVSKGDISLANALALRDLSPEAQAAAILVKARAKAKGLRPPRVAGEAPTPSTKPTKRAVLNLARELGGAYQLALLWAIGEVSQEAASENEQIAKAFSAGKKR